MSELSTFGQIIKALNLAKVAHVGVEFTYFDVIELIGNIDNSNEYISELESQLADAQMQLAEYKEEFNPAVYHPTIGAKEKK